MLFLKCHVLHHLTHLLHKMNKFHANILTYEKEGLTMGFHCSKNTEDITSSCRLKASIQQHFITQNYFGLAY